MSADKMREALHGLICAYVNTLEIGRDRILSNGGECDTVEVMKASDPALRAAREALASQAAQGEAVGEVESETDGKWGKREVVRLYVRLDPGTKLYTTPPAQLALAVPSTWPKIEHPDRPAEADFEAIDLQRRVAEVGTAALANTLRLYALSQPAKGSFAGSLWAMYECLAAAHLAAPAPAVPEVATPEIERALCQHYDGHAPTSNELQAFWTDIRAAMLAAVPETPR